MTDNTLEGELITRSKPQSEAIKNSTIEDRIKTYAHHWVNGNSKKDSYAAAGYSCATYSNAAVFHKRYLKEINEAVVDEMAEMTEDSRRVMEDDRRRKVDAMACHLDGNEVR